MQFFTLFSVSLKTIFYPNAIIKKAIFNGMATAPGNQSNHAERYIFGSGHVQVDF